MTRRRVVVTGMGVVAPNGVGLDDFDAALRSGRSGLRHVPMLAELGFGCTVAGVPQGTDAIAESYFDPDLLLAMNSNHRFGSIAAVDAWVDAGFARPDRSDDHVYWEAGAVLGTGIGGLDTVGGKLVPMTDAGKVRRLGSTIVEQVMSSGISARVSGCLALGNQVTTNSSACSTGTEAILEGAARIRAGLAERMLCGGSEGDSHYIWAGFDGMKVLSRRFNDEPGKTSRPMSASAGGFVPASGAGVLHLESLDSARERGARVHAEVLGGAINCGGHRGGGSMTAPNPTSVRRCIQGPSPTPASPPPRSTRSTDTSPPPAPTRARSRRGRRPWPRARRASADHLDQVDDRPRARGGGGHRVGGVRPDAARGLRPPLAQLRGRAPADRAVRGVYPPRDPRGARARHDRQGELRVRRRQRVRRVSKVDGRLARAPGPGGPQMTQEQIFTKVVEILKPYAKDPAALASVSLDTNILSGLKVNSARLVDVVLAFEDAFGIEVADDDADKVQTVGDAVGLIQGKLA